MSILFWHDAHYFTLFDYNQFGDDPKILTMEFFNDRCDGFVGYNA